jgi:hypothetical protein
MAVPFSVSEHHFIDAIKASEEEAEHHFQGASLHCYLIMNILLVVDAVQAISL